MSLSGLPSGFFSGRTEAPAIWTGKEMLIWGGNCPESVVCNGGVAYDPVQDHWRAMSDLNGPPRGRERYAAVWTGTRMILWGGTEYDTLHPNTMLKTVGDGFAYDPEKDEWAPISSAGSPGIGTGRAFAWTGSRMLIWLGPGDGALYDPVADKWQSMSSAGAPGDHFYFAAWTETELLIWSNSPDNGSAAYNPTLDKWRPISPENDPYSAEGPVVWTGTEMLIWAGSSSSPGGRYDPKTDQWGAMSRAGQPSQRRGAVGVWTGTEMIVWGGGLSGLIDLPDGARFTP